jgi:hypothetical protein
MLEFDEVSIYECRTVETPLTASVLFHAGCNEDIALVVGGHRRMSFFSAAAQIYKHQGDVGIVCFTNKPRLFREELMKPLDISHESLIFIGTNEVERQENNYNSAQLRKWGVQAIMEQVLYRDLAHISNIHVIVHEPVLDHVTAFDITRQTGITYKEILTLSDLLGQDSRVLSMDIVDFDPTSVQCQSDLDKRCGILSDIVAKTFCY